MWKKVVLWLALLFLVMELAPCAWAQSSASMPKPKRTADRKWWLWTAIQVSSMVADLELTQACIRARTCHEFNPLVGGRRWRAYAINIPLHALLARKSYQWKKHEDRGEHKAMEWWTVPLSGTTVHGVGIVYTAAQGFRSLPPCPPLPLAHPMRCTPRLN